MTTSVQQESQSSDEQPAPFPIHPNHTPSSSLLWLLPDVEIFDKVVDWIDRWHGSKETELPGPVLKDLERYFQDLDVSDLWGTAAALECLAAASAIRPFFCQTSEHNRDLAVGKLQQAIAIEWDYRDQPWMHQLMQVELPLTIAFQLAETPYAIEGLEKPAIAAMETAVHNLLDGDGLIQSRHVTVLGPLVAGWTRSWHLLRRLGFTIQKDYQAQLEWLVRYMFRGLRPNGQLLGAPETSQSVQPEFVAELLALSQDELDPRLAKTCLPDSDHRGKLEEVPEESAVSEWGRLAILQTAWKRKSSRSLILFQDQTSWIELCRKQRLIQGDVTPRINLGQRQVVAIDEFEMTCWQSDEHVDYLELELEFEDDVTLERQFLLSREDEFLLIADTIHLHDDATDPTIHYELPLPLAPGTKAITETETWEVYLHHKKIQALVIPFALPEWKQERETGSLEVSDDGLVLKQHRQGRSLYAGVFIDLKPKRSLRPRTWRSLTVAENLEIVSADTAVAFRVQVGGKQWVFYRNIGTVGNRTFLGENFADDFYVARFHRDGEVEPLLEIE